MTAAPAIATGHCHFADQRGLAGLRAIADEWRALAAACVRPAFYHQPEWFEAYLGGLARDPETVHFVTLRRDGRLVAVAPLERRWRWRGGLCYRALMFPQDTEHMPAGDFTVATDADPREVVREVLSGCARTEGLRWHALHLECLPDSAFCATALPLVSDYAGVRRPVGYRDVVALQPMDAMLHTLSRHNRGRLRTAQHRLERAGGASFATVGGGPGFEAALEEFFDLEATGWKARAGTAIRQSGRLLTFYRRLGALFAARGACDVHTLRIDGRPVAAVFMLTTGPTSYALKAAYDEAYAPLSPGNCLYAYAMQYYWERTQVRTLNLMSDYAYLHMWNPSREPERDVTLFDRSAAGAAAQVAVRVSQAWHRAYGATLYPCIRKAGRVWDRLARRGQPGLPPGGGAGSDAGKADQPMPCSRWAAGDDA